MKLIGIGRLGRDVEMTYSQSGQPIARMAVAWNHGKAGDDGKRPTQWANLSMFGERAEKVAPYLLKGTQIFAVCRDVVVETYERRDGNGTGVTLKAIVEDLQLVGSRPQGDGGAAPAPAPRPAAAPKPAPKPAASSGFDDMDDDIPF